MDIELKSRTVYLIRILLGSEDGLDVASILERLDVTKRTLYYELERINEWLFEKRLGSVKVVSHRVILFAGSKDILQRELDKIRSYYFSIEERKAMEVVMIALSDSPMTLEIMRTFFDVSKNTILFDIRDLKSELAGRNIILTSQVKSGYLIEGSEASVRKLIGEELQKLVNPGVRNLLRSIMQRSLESMTTNNIDFHEIARCLTRQYEKDIKGEIFLHETEFVNLMILVSWIRSTKGYIFNMSSVEKFALSNSASYRSVELSVQKLKIHGLKIHPMEIFFIAPLFLGIHTSSFVSEEQEDSYIADFTYELLKNFERISCISFVDKERLKNQLVFHIRPLYFRLKYGITSVNPLLDDVKRMYPVIFRFTGMAIKETDSEICRMITDDEIGYLCIHFASHLNEKRIIKPSAAIMDRILVVGESNMATSILVEDQLRSLLGNSFKYELVSTSKIREWMLDDYVLVISTAYNSTRFICGHLVSTGPIISDLSKKRILMIINDRGASNETNSKVNDIIRIVGEYVKDDAARTNLYFDLFRLMNKEATGEDLVSIEGIDKKIKNGEVIQSGAKRVWNSVLMDGCLSLVGEDRGIRLYNRMVNLIMKNGNKTFNVMDDVLLIHCPMQGDPDAGVDLAVVVSEEQIEFPNCSGASVIVFLMTKDNYSHWTVLDEIYSYFQNRNRLTGIKELYGTIEKMKTIGEEEWKRNAYIAGNL